MQYNINDASYSYDVQGDGSPILLLHGFTSTKSTWSPFVTDWKEKYQCITIDLPGHGETTTEIPRTIKEFCQDLVEFLRYLGLSKVHLVGYSMGGRIALSFAMLYPESVSTLTLESASPGLHTKEEQLARIDQDEKLAHKLERNGIKAFVDYWEDLPIFDTQKNLPFHVQKRIRAERLQQKEESLAESLRFMGTGQQTSWWERLGELNSPVLLIVGEKDKKFIRINELMEKSLPNVECKQIKNTGHAIHVEQSVIFGKLVEEFIKKHL